MTERYLTRSQTLRRLQQGDILERFENYGAFQSDGAKVKHNVLRLLVAEELIENAKPSIGAVYSLKQQPQWRPE